MSNSRQTFLCTSGVVNVTSAYIDMQIKRKVKQLSVHTLESAKFTSNILSKSGNVKLTPGVVNVTSVYIDMQIKIKVKQLSVHTSESAKFTSNILSKSGNVKLHQTL